MSIKSRKRPVASFINQADPRALGLMLAALPGFALAAAPSEAPREQRLGTIAVTEEVEREGYKADTASSPKFTAPLLDTPQTVTVLTKELLADQAAGSLAEALRNTPGISFTLGENGNTTAGDSITMRGFDTAGSIFLDGIRDLGAVSRDVFNTEQIEIVKGPSGSDNGRGAPTGYINLSSKQPHLEDALSGTIGAGTDNRVRVTGDLNAPIDGIDGAAARLNLMYDRGDRPARDVSETGKWGIAPSFALGLGTDTRAYFNYLFVKQNNVPDGGIPALGVIGYNAATTTGTPPVAINPALVTALNTAERVDRGNFYGSVDDYEHVQANMFTFKFEHDLSDVTTVRNTSRYGRNSLQRTITGINAITASTGGTGVTSVVLPRSAWTLSRSRQYRNELNEILTNQSNLTSVFNTGGLQHSLSTGVEFIYERQLSLGATAVGTTPAASLDNPNAADSMAQFAKNGAATDGKTLTGAAYLFDTVRFNEQWSVNAGVRFDRYRTETSTIPATATPPAASTFIKGDGDLLTGKVGLVFKPVANGSIYVSIASSEQPPGGANFTLNSGATNIANPNLDPQKARNIEIGTKWDLLDNRLVVTGAAFDTRNKNDLAQQDPATGEVTQYGERQVRGFELSAAGMITPNWQVTAGFASLDTEVKEGTATTTGAQLTFTPKLTFTSWTTYTFPFGLKIGGGARYTDSQFRNGNATQAAQTNLAMNPSAWVFDAMAGFDVNDHVSLQLNANNVTDKFYLNSLNNGGSRFVLGAPRTIMLSAILTK
jgi:catecholate siderophore receptor